MKPKKPSAKNAFDTAFLGMPETPSELICLKDNQEDGEKVEKPELPATKSNYVYMCAVPSNTNTGCIGVNEKGQNTNYPVKIVLKSILQRIQIPTI